MTRLVINDEDRVVFGKIGYITSRLVHTVLDSLSKEPTMTRRGLVSRFEAHSVELSLLIEKLHKIEE